MQHFQQGILSICLATYTLLRCDNKFYDFNPFMPKLIYHCYQLDKCISNLRVLGCSLQFHLNFKSTVCQQTVQNAFSD